MLRKALMAAAVATAAAVAPAAAAPLTGTFTIDIYQGNGGGNIGAPGVQANLANPLIAPGTLLDSVTYTGAIAFGSPPGPNTIGGFLGSAGGTIVGLDAAVAAAVLSLGGFTTTTVLDIQGTLATDIAGTILHDDGVSVYQGGAQVVNSATPTNPVATPYSLAAGDFRVIYVAANNLPEQLNIDVARVPEPASLALFGAGLLGLAAARRRGRKATVAV